MVTPTTCVNGEHSWTSVTCSLATRRSRSLLLLEASTPPTKRRCLSQLFGDTYGYLRNLWISIDIYGYLKHSCVDQSLHKVFFLCFAIPIIGLKFQTTNPLLVCNELMTHLEMNLSRRLTKTSALRASESFSHSQRLTVQRHFVYLQSLELTPCKAPWFAGQYSQLSYCLRWCSGLSCGHRWKAWQLGAPICFPSPTWRNMVATKMLESWQAWNGASP